MNRKMIVPIGFSSLGVLAVLSVALLFVYYRMAGKAEVPQAQESAAGMTD